MTTRIKAQPIPVRGGSGTDGDGDDERASGDEGVPFPEARASLFSGEGKRTRGSSNYEGIRELLDARIIPPDAIPYSGSSLKTTLRVFEAVCSFVALSLAASVDYAAFFPAESLLLISCWALLASLFAILADFSGWQLRYWYCWPLLELATDVSLAVLLFCAGVALWRECEGSWPGGDSRYCEKGSPVIGSRSKPRAAAVFGGAAGLLGFAGSVIVDYSRLRRRL